MGRQSSRRVRIRATAIGVSSPDSCLPVMRPWKISARYETKMFSMDLHNQRIPLPFSRTSPEPPASGLCTRSTASPPSSEGSDCVRTKLDKSHSSHSSGDQKRSYSPSSNATETTKNCERQRKAPNAKVHVHWLSRRPPLRKLLHIPLSHHLHSLAQCKVPARPKKQRHSGFFRCGKWVSREHVRSFSSPFQG